MKKCVFYIDPQSYGNLSIYDISLLRWNKDYDIKYICSNKFDRELIDSIQYFPIFCYNDKKSIFKVLSYCRSLILLFIKILSSKPVIIHIQWIRIPYIELFFYRFAKILTNSRIIYTAHNVLPHDTGNAKKIVYSKVYSMVDTIIVHTERSKNEIINMTLVNPKKIKVIRHGLLHYKMDSQSVQDKMAEMSEKYNLKNKFIFLSIGNQDYYKGSDMIIDVWKDTSELNKASDCILLMLGKNHVEYELLSNFNNSIVENRFLTDLEFIAALKLTDVLLMPYRKISQSGVLLSALDTRTPVLVTDVGGISEPLSIAKIGWRINEADVDCLRKEMLFLYKNKNEVYQVKHNLTNWNAVQKEYDWKNISAQTFSIYSNEVV